MIQATEICQVTAAALSVCKLEKALLDTNSSLLMGEWDPRFVFVQYSDSYNIRELLTGILSNQYSPAL